MTAQCWYPENLRSILEYGFPHYIERLSPAIWLDAQNYGSLSFNGSSVSAWASKSNGLVASQGTAAQQPLYVASAINGRPALQGYHAGVASQLSIPDSSLLDYTQFTSFSVIARVSDLAANEIVSAKYTATGNQFEHYHSVDSSDNIICQVSTDGTFTNRKTSFKSSLGLATPALIMGRYDGTNVIATLAGTDGGSTAASAVYNGTSPYTLFSRIGPSDPYAGYIGEHLFFTRLLSSSDRSVVYNYLKQKWGM